MKPSDTREIFGCNVCGETWVHTGDAKCPFCGSDDTEPVVEEKDDSPPAQGTAVPSRD